MNKKLQLDKEFLHVTQQYRTGYKYNVWVQKKIDSTPKGSYLQHDCSIEKGLKLSLIQQMEEHHIHHFLFAPSSADKKDSSAPFSKMNTITWVLQYQYTRILCWFR